MSNETSSALSFTASTSTGPKPLHLPLGSVIGSSGSPSTPDFNSSSSYPPPGSPHSAVDIGTNGISCPSQLNSADNISNAKASPGSRPKPIILNSPSSTSSRADSPFASPSPLSPSISGLRKQSNYSNPNSRRQSSISYISSSSSPNGHSPSSSHFAFTPNHKRQSVDASSMLVRSPLASVHPNLGAGLGDAFAGSGGSSLGRSNSLGGSRGGRGFSKATRSPHVGGDKDRSSTGSIVPGQNVKHLKERPPVTLAEKHAELLHFIAQKESKCLELRSQLAVHEAELLQLKRKWERIVNRGFDRALSPTSSATTANARSPDLSSSPNAPSTTLGTNHFLSTSSDDRTFSPNSAGAGAGAAVVLEGIKEGVQGMSRLIAAGFESIVHVGPAGAASPSESSESAQGRSGGTTAPAPPLPLKLGSVTCGSGKNGGSGSLKRQSYVSHEQKESQSSSASGSSTRTSGTFSSLLSAGSAASTTTSTSSSASASLHSTSSSTSTSRTTTREAHIDTDAYDDADGFGEFQDAHPNHGSQEPTSSSDTSIDDEHEQVLMVQDTGATPTMSPNPAFEKRRRRIGERERKRVEVERLVLGPVSANRSEDRDQDKDLNRRRGPEEPELGWDEDGWGGHVNDAEHSALGATSSRDRSHQKRLQPQQIRNSSTSSGHSSGPKSPLAPMSSIPGLSMSMNAPSAQQVSSWVGSVGKKWGEIAKGGSTFVKNQKRASLLLSDMQQSIVSALGSPVSISGTPLTASSKTPASSSLSPQTSNAPSFSSNASHNGPTSASSTSSSSSHPNSASTSTSLLDGSDDESYGESSAVGVNSTPIMVPDSLNGPSKSALTTPRMRKTAGAAAEEDEDEWNW